MRSIDGLRLDRPPVPGSRSVEEETVPEPVRAGLFALALAVFLVLVAVATLAFLRVAKFPWWT